MSFSCPRCPFGMFQPVKSTYVRRWGPYIVTVPNFAMYRCDCCGHTRYDVAALSRLTLLLGSESGEWQQTPRRRPLPTQGPGERGPRSWSS